MYIYIRTYTLMYTHTYAHIHSCTHIHTHIHTHVHTYIRTHIHTHIHAHHFQLWARAFRDRDFHAAVNTNNGTETLNKLLKYNFLPRKKAMTLSAIATLIVENFLPDTYQKYLFLNYKQSTQYRSYRSIVPEYLHGNPDLSSSTV